MPQPPSTAAALAGAEILLNLSASNITIGKAQMRRLLCASQSARCLAAYAYSAAGAGESTTDLAWDGQAGIFELGEGLAETERFSARAGNGGRRCRSRPHPAGADAHQHLRRLRARRRRRRRRGSARSASISPRRASRLALRRNVERFPYVPADPAMLRDNCYEAYNIQVQGLAQPAGGDRARKSS